MCAVPAANPLAPNPAFDQKFFPDHQIRLARLDHLVHSGEEYADDFRLVPDPAAASAGPDVDHPGVAGFPELSQAPVRGSPCALASVDVAEVSALADAMAAQALPDGRLLALQAVAA